jgi:hypothetical protein
VHSTFLLCTFSFYGNDVFEFVCLCFFHQWFLWVCAFEASCINISLRSTSIINLFTWHSHNVPITFVLFTSKTKFVCMSYKLWALEWMQGMVAHFWNHSNNFYRVLLFKCYGR